jgi:tetratricopeptide (TPR) repeat protein
VGPLSNGHGALSRGELSKAERLYQEAEAVFEEIGYRASLAALLNNVAEVLFLQGHLERANDSLERAATHTRHSTDPRVSIIVPLNLANVAAERGAFARADEAYEKALQQCRKLGDKSLEEACSGTGRTRSSTRATSSPPTACSRRP